LIPPGIVAVVGIVPWIVIPVKRIVIIVGIERIEKWIIITIAVVWVPIKRTEGNTKGYA